MSTISQLSEKQISPENFRGLYSELHKITSSGGNLSKVENDVKILIESIIEYLISGDKNDSSIFDIFCELNFMNEFIFLSNSKNRIINLQIIKSFALLISNLTNKQSIYFLFSNNFINQIISCDFDKTDNDFLYYYVNFIKSLCLKIDETTIQFFFHKQMNTFPLLENCLKLYNHPDPMINNVIRNNFLTIAKIKYEPVIEYICGMPTLQYFAFISCRARDMIKTLNKKISKGNGNTNKANFLNNINLINEEIINDILFFQDIYSLNIEKVNFILTNALFHYIMLPLLCGNIMSNENYVPDKDKDKEKEKEKEREKYKIHPNVVFYTLTLFYRYIKNENFLNALTLILFSKKIHIKILEEINNPPKNLSNYENDWSVACKSKKLKFKDFIMLNFTESFARSLVFHINSPYSDINSLIKKLENKYKGINTGLNTTSPEVYKSILEELYHILSNREMESIHIYHSAISKATGIQTGLSYKDDHLCFLNLMQKTLTLIKQSLSMETDETKFVNNDIRTGMFRFLQSKEDQTIFLCSLLINEILNKENISDEVKAYSKLLSPEKITENKAKGCEEGEPSIKALNIGNLLSEVEIQSEHKKKEKKKSDDKLNFANLYPITLKEDFCFKEFFLCNNEKIKTYIKNNQVSYNYEFVTRFINLAQNSDKPGFAGKTIRIIVDNLERLIFYNDKKEMLPLDTTHIKKIKAAYYHNLKEIGAILENSKAVQHSCLSIYEKEAKNYAIKLSNLISSCLSEPYALLKQEEVQEQINTNTQINTTKAEIKAFKIHIMTIMSLYEIFSSIIKIDKITFEQVKGTIGGSLNEMKIEKKEEHKCKICQEHNTGFKDGTIALNEDNYLEVVIESINYHNNIKVSSLEVQIDRSEPRIINIVYTDEEGEIKEILVSFKEDVAKTVQIKRLLEDQSNFLRNNEFRLVKGFFDKLVTQYIANNISK